MSRVPPAAILDIDGTLVDTNYHHAVAWYRAFRQAGLVFPIWHIHRHIGVGGDQFVEYVGGERAKEHEDEIVAAHSSHYSVLIEEVEPFPAARELIVTLKDRGHEVVLASSASSGELDHYLDQLDARDLADDWTSSEDVETSKPAPDLIEAALEKAGRRDAVLVGDTIWDIEAAGKAGVETIALLTGASPTPSCARRARWRSSSRSRSCSSDSTRRRSPAAERWLARRCAP